MFGWFRSKSLTEVLDQTKTVKIGGVRFTIRKVNVLDFLAGNDIMLQSFDKYAVGAQPQISEKKAREFISQVIVAGTVNPKLSHKEEEGKVCIDKMWVNQEMVSRLHVEIMTFTYGKKKMKSVISSMRNAQRAST